MIDFILEPFKSKFNFKKIINDGAELIKKGFNAYIQAWKEVTFKEFIAFPFEELSKLLKFIISYIYKSDKITFKYAYLLTHKSYIYLSYLVRSIVWFFNNLYLDLRIIYLESMIRSLVYINSPTWEEEQWNSKAKENNKNIIKRYKINRYYEDKDFDHPYLKPEFFMMIELIKYFYYFSFYHLTYFYGDFERLFKKSKIYFYYLYFQQYPFKRDYKRFKNIFINPKEYVKYKNTLIKPKEFLNNLFKKITIHNFKDYISYKINDMKKTGRETISSIFQVKPLKKEPYDKFYYDDEGEICCKEGYIKDPITGIPTYWDINEDMDDLETIDISKSNYPVVTPDSEIIDIKSDPEDCPENDEDEEDKPSPRFLKAEDCPMVCPEDCDQDCPTLPEIIKKPKADNHSENVEASLFHTPVTIEKPKEDDHSENVDPYIDRLEVYPTFLNIGDFVQECQELDKDKPDPEINDNKTEEITEEERIKYELRHIKSFPSITSEEEMIKFVKEVEKNKQLCNTTRNYSEPKPDPTIPDADDLPQETQEDIDIKSDQEDDYSKFIKTSKINKSKTDPIKPEKNIDISFLKCYKVTYINNKIIKSQLIKNNTPEDFNPDDYEKIIEFEKLEINSNDQEYIEGIEIKIEFTKYTKKSK